MTSTTPSPQPCAPASIPRIHTAPSPPGLQTPAISLSTEDSRLFDAHRACLTALRRAVPQRPPTTLDRRDRARTTAPQSFTTARREPPITPPALSPAMDFAYSPHRETGGTMHLPSPTHHAYRMEGAHFSSLQQLRHSLSRSPSKPSRFQLRSAKADLPGSPISPLALTRAFSPKTHKPASPIAAYSESPFGSQAPQTTKKKFALRRSAPFRSSPRNRGAVSKSPRRALIDSADSGNSSPFVPRTLFGEENTPARKPSAEFWDMGDSKRYDIDDKPIKFEFARSHQANSSAPGANCFASTQPSPLKRRDGIMGFESTISDTPNPKRRSLHGTADFNIFEQTPARTSTEELSRAHDTETTNIFSTPAPNTQSPMRRTTSLRRSASQRSGANSPRAKVAKDSEFAFPGPAASKTRNRMSLDSSFLASSGVPESPFTRSTASQPFMRGGGPAYQRHPLSNALTASSSSSLGDETPMRAPAPPMAAPKKDRFSKSLPIVGPPRPQPPQESVHPGGFATPFAMKMSQLHPGPLVRSTGGLISKKNRDVDSPRAEKYHMPDTPSKRFSYPSVAAESPITIKRGSLFDKFQQHEFGTPSTHTSKPPSESFGKGVSIFGSFGSNHGRRGSFLSIDGGDDDNSHSPLGNHMTDSQSSADDMPPTPTKHHDGAGRRSKESSLRRKTFRQRASVGTDTFAAAENPGIEIPAASMTQSVPVPGASPHTPNESFMPPDPSRLTISGQRRGSLPFNASLPSSSYPPMTPTTPRDHSLWLGNAQPAIPIGLPKNDVDESLSSLFHDVKKLNGELGEFSQVFKVSRPFKHGSSHPSPGSRFWIVKKSKKPFMGPSDREKKMREVRALLALRGNDHVVSIEGHWEHAGHLYIQTEYCEGGDLKTFLNDVGYKSRLDDFRIWKILLELSLVSHLTHNPINC